jgi:hypothetical protein
LIIRALLKKFAAFVRTQKPENEEKAPASCRARSFTIRGPRVQNLIEFRSCESTLNISSAVPSVNATILLDEIQSVIKEWDTESAVAFV